MPFNSFIFLVLVVFDDDDNNDNNDDDYDDSDNNDDVDDGGTEGRRDGGTDTSYRDAEAHLKSILAVQHKSYWSLKCNTIKCASIS